MQADLLPGGADEADVAAWLEGTAQHKKLSPIATFLVSSRTGMMQTASRSCCLDDLISAYSGAWSSALNHMKTSAEPVTGLQCPSVSELFHQLQVY